jgi:hypothetical protein
MMNLRSISGGKPSLTICKTLHQPTACHDSKGVTKADASCYERL